MNDILPEEQDPKFEELITLLREADLNAPFIDQAEHAQIISHAKARLFPTEYEVAQLAVQEPGSLPSMSSVRRSEQGQLIHLVNMLAAVLVVAALIGSVLLLFGPWSPLRQNHVGSGPPIGPVGSPVLVRDVTLDGFETIFKITPGPYFLGELLEVDLVITNRTHIAYSLVPPTYNPNNNPSCSGFLHVTTTGGGSPYATAVQSSWSGLPETLLKCNTPPYQEVRLPTNQSFKNRQYVQITSSGYVTLTATVGFRKATNEFGPQNFSPTTSTGIPLQLFVSALVPSDRQLSVKEQNTKVVVSGPPAVRGQLIGEWETACTQGSSIVFGPKSLSGVSVTAMPSQCSSMVTTLNVYHTPLWWAYIVGAPGYALVLGRVNG